MMMKNGKDRDYKKDFKIMVLRFILTMALIFFTVPVFAQRKITVKLASLVPENSPWGEFLNEIAREWKRISNGEIELIIYHNRTAGKEDSVRRNLRSNQLQMAVLSSFGLSEIVPEVMSLSCPFLIRNDAELELVFNALRSDLESKINANGFFTLAWSNVGWVKVFSKQPVFVPADLKKQKLGTNADFDKLNHAFRSMGFQMVPVAQDEILIALSSPMVDAVYQSPIAVGGTQVFGLAQNMASINIAPFMGAIVINQQTWRRIPDSYKPQLVEAVRKLEKALDQKVKAFEAELIKTMGNYGLKVNVLTQAQEKLWYDEIERAMPGMIGTVIDKEMYTRIEAILRAHRR
ncbi:MAG: TRAP transporter substrate-binding protein DctP [Treponema sp.]|nr:TRAP transporter substrate-binding protein DctP [Treponema sp.]